MANARGGETRPAHLYLATPAYDGKVSVAYAQSLVRTVVNCAMANIKVTADHKLGCCYIDFARNWLVDRFLKSDADALLFVDADMGWDSKAAAKLYHSPFGVVGGAYPMKTDGEAAYPIELLGPEQNGFREALYLPTGFLLIRRPVFELMRDHVPQYRDKESGELVHAFFQCVAATEGYIGEDVEFCNRWRALGGRVWCWPNIDFEHQGGRIWHGNYALHLLRQASRTDEVAAA